MRSTSLRASTIYAGTEVARRRAATGQSVDDAVRHLRQGEAYLSSLDYPTALAWFERFGEAVFVGGNDSRTAFREAIDRVARAERPSWVDYAPLGRRKVLDVLDEDARQCFGIAGLLDGSPETIAWWDRLAAWSRATLSDKLLEIGRDGEERTLAWEYAHLADTDLEPRYVAIEDNTAGYDVFSWRKGVGGMDTKAGWSPHYIEAKRSLGGEAVHMSGNEWRFALDHGASWETQIWVGDATEPLVVRVEDLRPHMPANAGEGRWESTEIPISALRDDDTSKGQELLSGEGREPWITAEG